MPIYEFRCNSCRTVSSVFVRSFSSPLAPSCAQCGSEDLTRLVSRPFVMKGDLDRMEDFDVAGSLRRLEDPYDPAAVARWARQMGSELGDELGAELREMAEQVESDQDTYDAYDPAIRSDPSGDIPPDAVWHEDTPLAEGSSTRSVFPDPS